MDLPYILHPHDYNGNNGSISNNGTLADVEEDDGRISSDFLENNPNIGLSYLIVICTATAVGTLGNPLIIAVIVLNKVSYVKHVYYLMFFMYFLFVISVNLFLNLASINWSHHGISKVKY